MTTKRAITSNPFSSRPWAARVPETARRALSVFRTWPDLAACEAESGLWVRSEAPDDSRSGELVEKLRVEAAAELFEITKNSELIPLGRRVPQGELPRGPWIPLAQLLTVVWPVAGFAANRPEECPLKLIRSDREIDPSALELDLGTWAGLAVETPEIRLARWEFAATERGRALIRGLPLPSVDGERFYEREGVLIPVGYRWEPDVAPAVVRRLASLHAEELMLWRAGAEQWERIPTAAFAPARRANVRQTVIELSTREAPA